MWYLKPVFFAVKSKFFEEYCYLLWNYKFNDFSNSAFYHKLFSADSNVHRSKIIAWVRYSKNNRYTHAKLGRRNALSHEIHTNIRTPQKIYEIHTALERKYVCAVSFVCESNQKTFRTRMCPWRHARGHHKRRTLRRSVLLRVRTHRTFFMGKIFKLFSIRAQDATRADVHGAWPFRRWRAGRQPDERVRMGWGGASLSLAWAFEMHAQRNTAETVDRYTPAERWELRQTTQVFN